MLLINNQHDLNHICELLALASIIGVDTEFERKYHYFANLSIIQLVTPNVKVVIDALADMDLTPLKKVILDDNILKILHSPRQDLEIFYKIFSAIPNNIFDTQLAAEICDYGASISYSKLCDIFLSRKIDKQYQTADWMARPLEQSMLEYAIIDAEYLIPLYNHLNLILDSRHLQSEYSLKLQELLNPQNYQPNFSEAWRKVKFHKSSAKFLYKMQLIAGYREQCAARANLPRKHFASDEDLIKLCHILPINNQEFNRLQLDKNHFSKSIYRKKLLELCMQLKHYS